MNTDLQYKDLYSLTEEPLITDSINTLCNSGQHAWTVADPARLHGLHGTPLSTRTTDDDGRSTDEFILLAVYYFMRGEYEGWIYTCT